MSSLSELTFLVWIAFFACAAASGAGYYAGSTITSVIFGLLAFVIFLFISAIGWAEQIARLQRQVHHEGMDNT